MFEFVLGVTVVVFLIFVVGYVCGLVWGLFVCRCCWFILIGFVVDLFCCVKVVGWFLVVW